MVNPTDKFYKIRYYTIHIFIYLYTTTTTMKVSKLLSLDYELVQRLKQEDNASAVVNQLIMSHYKDMRTDEEIIADVKIKIAEKQESLDREKRIAEAVKKRVKEMKKNAKHI